jgi:hypothetical protein
VRKLFCGLAAAATTAWAAAANAGWAASLDLERFHWEEATTPPVTEQGPRVGFSWEFEQLRPAGWQFAYRGQFRYGTVDYNGSFLFSGEKATARVEYTGLLNEAQAIYRVPGSPFGLELVGGLGLDYWRRNILPDQIEDYSVLFLRAGLNADPRGSQGWFGGAGLKFPLYVLENAHLDAIGFDQNPLLEPQGEVSAYAQLGYRFAPQWSVIGYYDSYRFGQSADVAATSSDPGICPPTTPGVPRRCSFAVHQPASRIDTFGLRLRYSF